MRGPSSTSTVETVRRDLDVLGRAIVPFLLAGGDGDQAANVLRLLDQLPHEDDALVLAEAARLTWLLHVAGELASPCRGEA